MHNALLTSGLLLLCWVWWQEAIWLCCCLCVYSVKLEAMKHHFLSQHPCDSLYEGRNRFVICLLGSSFPFLAAEEWAAAWNLAVGTVLLAAPLNEVLWGVSMCIRVVAAQLLQGSDCEKQTFFKANQLCCCLPGRLIVTSTGPLKLSQLLVQSAFGDIKMQW